MGLCYPLAQTIWVLPSSGKFLEMQIRIGANQKVTIGLSSPSLAMWGYELLSRQLPYSKAGRYP